MIVARPEVFREMEKAAVRLAEMVNYRYVCKDFYIDFFTFCCQVKNLQSCLDGVW